MQGLHQLIERSTRPILEIDQPWEQGGMLSAVTVLPDVDKDRLRMYYRAGFRDDPRKNMLCVAYSSDGDAWEKPDLGDGTNIVMWSSGHHCDWGTFMPTRILHNPEENDPMQQWKMVYWDRPTATAPPGICLATSPDGIRWTPLSDHPIITNANDAMSMIDAHPDIPTPFHKATFFLYQQTWAYNPALPQARDNLKGMHRRISIWTTADFTGRWIGPVTILEPDAEDPPDVQFYWLTPFHLDEGYGGLLCCHHTRDQTMDVQLVTSLDGWTWQRANDRHPILPLGEPGHFDCGMVSTVAPPVTWHGQVLLFYNGRATVHDGQARYPDQPLSDPAHGIGIASLPKWPSLDQYSSLPANELLYTFWRRQPSMNHKT